MSLLYCGRMDDHHEHDWTGRKTEWMSDGKWDRPVTTYTTYRCKGTPVSEGAAPCMDCGDPSANGGPRCIPCAIESNRHEREKDEEWWS